MLRLTDTHVASLLSSFLEHGLFWDWMNNLDLRWSFPRILPLKTIGGGHRYKAFVQLVQKHKSHPPAKQLIAHGIPQHKLRIWSARISQVTKQYIKSLSNSVSMKLRECPLEWYVALTPLSRQWSALNANSLRIDASDHKVYHPRMRSWFANTCSAEVKNFLPESGQGDPVRVQCQRPTLSGYGRSSIS